MNAYLRRIYLLSFALVIMITGLNPHFVLAAADSTGEQEQGIPLGNNFWTHRGPVYLSGDSQAPLVYHLTYDRNSPSSIYATTNQGVYRSVDGGENWEARTQGLGGFGDLQVTWLSIDPSSSNRLLIATWGGGIYQSDDYGATWWRQSNPLSSNIVESSELFLDDTAAPIQVTAGGEPFEMNLMHETDRASRIVPDQAASEIILQDPINLLEPLRLPDPLSWVPVSQVVFNPANPLEVIACMGDGNGVYQGMRQANNSIVWIKQTSLGNKSCYTYQYSPSNSLIRYAALGSNLYRTGNGGLSWDDIGSGKISGIVYGLSIHPSDPNLVVAATLDPDGSGGAGSGALYRTTNGGVNWTNLRDTNPALLSENSFLSVAFAESNPSILYAGGERYIYRSQDSGVNWSNADSALTKPRGFSVAIHPSQPETVIAGASSLIPYGGAYKRTSPGSGFQLKPGGMQGTIVLDVEQDPLVPSTLYLAVWGLGVFRSNDAGLSWQNKNGDPYINAVDAVSSGGKTWLYAVTFYSDTGVLFSQDRADQWVEISHGNKSDISFDILAMDNAPGFVVAATWQGIQYSQDGGHTWIDGSGLTSGMVLSLCELSGNPAGRFLAGTYGGGTFFSPNGVNWYESSTGLGSNYIYSVACSRDQPGLAYAGGLGVYFSTDEGKSWGIFSAGLPVDLNGIHKPIRALDVAEGSKDVFAGTYQDGVFVSPQNSGFWTGINAALSEGRTRAVKVVSTVPYPRLFVGTLGRGSWEYSMSTSIAVKRIYLPAIAKSYYRFASASDTYEPNDTIDNAMQLSSPGTYYSYIWTNLDVDYYRFNLNTLGTISINLSEIPPGRDYDLRLYNQYGQVVGISEASSNQDEEILFQPIQSGTYFVKVYSYTGSSTTQAYRLKTAYNGPVGTGDIYGGMWINGIGAGSVLTALLRNNGHQIRPVFTITDLAGNYHFRGLGTLPLGHNYRIYYPNLEGNNQRLSEWYCYAFMGYTVGQSLASCSFDISNVSLETPADNSVVKLPVQFSWQKRNQSSDHYQVRMYGASGIPYIINPDVGYSNWYSLMSLPAGFGYGIPFNWDILIVQSGTGYGVSYYRRSLTISTTEILEGKIDNQEQQQPLVPVYGMPVHSWRK